MKKGKYNLVVGLGRSMTSAMMLAIRQSGVPVVGTPFYYWLDESEKPEGLPIDIGTYFAPNDKAKDTNPNGYWELPNLAINTGLTDEYAEIGREGDVVKVFASVLNKSNPNLINKVVFMLREPKAMLASMIKAGEFGVDDASRASVVLSNNIRDALDFLKENEKEYLIVRTEYFRIDPAGMMKNICEFLGRGDYRYGAEVIDPSLNRSMPRDDLGDISPLEEVYQLALEGKL